MFFSSLSASVSLLVALLRLKINAQNNLSPRQNNENSKHLHFNYYAREIDAFISNKLCFKIFWIIRIISMEEIVAIDFFFFVFLSLCCVFIVFCQLMNTRVVNSRNTRLVPASSYKNLYESTSLQLVGLCRFRRLHYYPTNQLRAKDASPDAT